jgi:hypothetical protein
MTDSIDVRLAKATVASCECMTKTPEVKFHNEDCRYRIIMEAMGELDKLRAERDAAIVRAEALHNALREVAITHPDSGLWLNCAVCGANWHLTTTKAESECHAPGCLAAPKGEG